MFSNDRVTDVVGQPEHCVSLNSAWPFSEPAICEAWQQTMILPTALTMYTFHDSWQIFVTDSFSSTKNSIIPPPFYESPTHAPELFHVAPTASKA